MAIKAASKDTRFKPITLSELSSLACGVSILSPLSPCADCWDWKVGVHGIVMNFKDDYQATYLPEVAAEQGWTQRETLESLAQKAGFHLQDSMLGEIRLQKYTSSKFKVTYEEWKDNLAENKRF